MFCAVIVHLFAVSHALRALFNYFLKGDSEAAHRQMSDLEWSGDIRLSLAL